MRDKKENSLLFDREKKKTANFAFDFSEVQMKKIVFGCCLLIFIASCGGNGKKVDPFEKLTEQLDSMNVGSDSVLQDTMVLVEEVIPVTVDESFADFFYNFASDEKFQRSRILFPMPYYEGKEVKRISREAWKFDPLFSRQDAYTILFDKAEEIRMSRAKALGRVWELEGKKEPIFPTSFSMPAVKKVSDDPFEQAAYAYSLIESEVDMGGTE